MKKNPKKFAFIGTMCIGKTTIITKLADNLSEKKNEKVIIVQEAARAYFTQHKVRFPISFLHQSNIQKLALKTEKEKLKENPTILLTDRSVLDAVAYLLAVDNTKGAQRLLEKVQAWLETYNHFFLLDPKDVPYISDEIRKKDAHKREAFHESFLKLLPTIKKPYTLISGDIDSRIEKVKKKIYSSL